MQVGGKSTYAWEKKWWEDAFNVKATGIQVSQARPFAGARSGSTS